MTENPKILLQQLVQIPSVNPAFPTGADSDHLGEANLTQFLQQFCERQQWDWARQQVAPGRENLIAVLPGRSLISDPATSPESTEVVLWDVHQDTVGVDGMRISPFGGQESDGRIWGRGATDVKGSMAAMLTALCRLAAEPAGNRPTILLTCTVNEENGFSGIGELCRLWESPLPEQYNASSSEDLSLVAGSLSVEQLRSLRPQAAIVAEPTLLNVVVAHKGVTRWRCHVTGRAAHTSQPECGENAIVAMAEVVRAIDRFHQEILACREPHPLCGGPTVCVSMIAGGTGVNTVPDHAVIDIDRRLIPNESPGAAYREIVAYVAENARVGRCQIRHDEPWLVSDSLTDNDNGPWSEQVVHAVRTAGQSSDVVGVPYGTNASVLGRLGIPTIVFGPGSIEQAHTDDEWIEIEQLDRAAELYYQLACCELAIDKTA